MKNNIFDLTGQVALVAGGSSGLGLQFAKAMANAGANVAIVARRTDRLEKNAKEIAAEYGVEVYPTTSTCATPSPSPSAWRTSSRTSARSTFWSTPAAPAAPATRRP